LIILWTHRHELRAAPKATFWPGLGLLILGVTLHWMGARAQQTRLSLLALILILWSIPLFLGGRRIGRLTLFPAALLVYCVPLNFLDVATFPMRIVSAAVAFVLLNGMGVAVTLAGSALVSDPPGAFVINGADSASGLGLLLIVSAFAAILAHYHQTRPLRQLVVFASCVPAVVIANILRLAVVAGWADALGEASALAANHRVAYAAVLVTSCLLVLGSSLCLNVDFRQLAKTWSPRK
jgi:exosortase